MLVRICVYFDYISIEYDDFRVGIDVDMLICG